MTERSPPDLSHLSDRELLIMFNGQLGAIDDFVKDMRETIYHHRHGLATRLQTVEERQIACLQTHEQDRSALRFTIPVLLTIALILVGIFQGYAMFQTLKLHERLSEAQKVGEVSSDSRPSVSLSGTFSRLSGDPAPR